MLPLPSRRSLSLPWHSDLSSLYMGRRDYFRSMVVQKLLAVEYTSGGIFRLTKTSDVDSNSTHGSYNFGSQAARIDVRNTENEGASCGSASKGSGSPARPQPYLSRAVKCPALGSIQLCAVGTTSLLKREEVAHPVPGVRGAKPRGRASHQSGQETPAAKLGSGRHGSERFCHAAVICHVKDPIGLLSTPSPEYRKGP